jgi:DNA invertase Pin-like site-specific DNA recombinase
MKKVRCAIYTRKSSEEGLEQGFNSLDAQREACGAYVLSQASEGWSLVPEKYDDGGISGGTLERPALQRLLTDVAAGRVDIIVVYKVDRLTRSLLDFAKLVEAFDAAGVSFVSVTQSFNTTTSMGRLTLNMLLSFAQFEREVTAERIRDKISASKAKGMWMGGTPPLGYRPNGRSLAIIEDHARFIRDIYRRYLELGNVRLVADQLATEGIRSPKRISGAGRQYGGSEFSRGQIYAILKNAVYVGDIVHHGQRYDGQQPAIIDRAPWQLVQERLSEHLQGGRRARTESSSLLAGIIVDEVGEPLVAVHACKGKVRYRYYVSRALQHASGAKTGIRLPAREIEMLVAGQLAAMFDDPLRLAARAWITIRPNTLPDLNLRCSDIAGELRRGSSEQLADLVGQVRVFSDRVEFDVPTARVAALLQTGVAEGASPTLTITTAVKLTRTGRALRLVQPGGSAVAGTAPDRTLIKLLLKARRWWTKLAEGEVDISLLARDEGVTPSYIARVVRLAFLAPTCVEMILEGNQRAMVDGAMLTAPDAIPACWGAQTSRYLEGAFQ